MSYRLTHFGSVPLPDRMPDDDLSTASVDSTLLDSLSGTVDYYGGTRRLPHKQQLGMHGIYLGELTYLVDHAGNKILDHAGNRILVGTAKNRLRAKVDNLRGMLGTRAALWRQREDDSVRQWRYARLLQVVMRGSVEQWAAVIAEIDAKFEMANGAWYADAIITNTNTLVSGGLAPLNVTAGGNVTVSDAVLTIAASGTITAITVTCPAISVAFSWSGTLSSGQSLVIDCGARTVRRGTTDLYSGVALGSNHTAAGWLPLAEGVNPLTIGANGPGTVTVTHYDQFL